MQAAQADGKTETVATGAALRVKASLAKSDNGRDKSSCSGVKPKTATICSLITCRSLASEPRTGRVSSGTKISGRLSISAKLFFIKLSATFAKICARMVATLFFAVSIKVVTFPLVKIKIFFTITAYVKNCKTDLRFRQKENGARRGRRLFLFMPIALGYREIYFSFP